MTVTIWHNPRCSKSRDTLALLEAEGVTLAIRLYLMDRPDGDEIRHVLALLECTAGDLLRPAESIAVDLGLDEGSDPELLIAAMERHPILIERPVVIHGDRAAIGRPPSAVLDIL